jgi:hypothetical protein
MLRETSQVPDGSNVAVGAGVSRSASRRSRRESLILEHDFPDPGSRDACLQRRVRTGLPNREPVRARGVAARERESAARAGRVAPLSAAPPGTGGPRARCAVRGP